MLTYNLLGLAIMVLVIAIEISLTLKEAADGRLKKDIKTNFLLGAVFIACGFLAKFFAFGLFTFCYQYAPFKPEPSWWLWVFAFLGCDFCYYYYHWLGHKSRIFWAAHSTHHSSTYFNASTGLRINFIHIFYRFIFSLPLCFAGIRPEMILFIDSIIAIENFVIHTEHVGRLGFLDYIINTPSTHRVHHAKNPQYLDKNMGGLTMIFDHLFGTFAIEKEKPVYGITHALPQNDTATIVLHEYRNMRKALTGLKGFMAKLKYIFEPPQ